MEYVNENISVKKLFMKYVSLNVISMLGLSFYILADTIFVSRAMGNNGLTALNLVIPIYSFVNGIGVMLGMGGAIKYSILAGQGVNKEEKNNIFTVTIILGIAFGLIFTVLGLFFSQPIARILGADEVILPMAADYLKTLLSFSVAFIVNDIIICFVRNDDNPNLSMAAMLLGSFTNIIFDYVFIFPMQMGMFGAALATGFAPIIGMAVSLLHFIKRKNKFTFCKPVFNIKPIVQIFSLGLPTFITEVSAGIIMILFNFVILSLAGNVGVASYGIIANLALIAMAVFNGIGQGIQPIISRNYGNKNFSNIKKVYAYAIVVALVLSTVFYLLCALFPENVILLFTEKGNEQLIIETTKGIRVYFASFVFMSLNIVTTSFFASINSGGKAFAISILRNIVFTIPILLILPKFINILGVWLTIPLAELITLGFSAFFYCKSDLRK